MNCQPSANRGQSVPTAIDYGLYHSADVFAAEQLLVFRGGTWCYLGLCVYDTHRIATLLVTPI